MNDAASQPITYARLSEVLVRLGFARRDAAEYVAFQNPQFNALFALPLTQPQELVRPAHLVAAQSAVTASGVASESTFWRMLTGGTLEDTCALSENSAAQSEAA